MGTRHVDPKTFSSVGVMQRVHENDLSQQCIDDGYQHLVLPMHFDADRAFKTYTLDGQLFAQDWRNDDGQLLFPERFDEAAVAAVVHNLGGLRSPTVEAQLEQRPAPPGGLIFLEEHFQAFVPGLSGPSPKDTFCIISVDCTFKDTAGADNVAIGVWGARDGKFFEYETIGEKWDLTGTIFAVKQVLARHPYASAVLVEDKANGPEVIKAIRREIHNVIAIDPKTSKVARAHAAAQSYKAKAVFHNEKSVGKKPLEAELKSFPRARHDDRVDATTMAVLYLAENSMADFLAAVKSFSKSTERAPSVFGQHFTIR
jgi:predicted phage terminase large subunit-like protein